MTAGKLSIPFPDVGQIDLDYSVTGLALTGNGAVDGSIRIDLKDIVVLEQLVPGLDRIHGQLSSDLKIMGTISDPTLDGFIRLKNAAADVPFLGTEFRNVSLEGSVSNHDNATLHGAFMAGDGRGEITVSSEFSNWLEPEFQMTMKGSTLRLLNSPELRVNADTDIKLGWKRGEWTVDGEVVVQKARIAPVSLVVAKVGVSEDVQVVAGELPYERDKTTVAPVRIKGQLQVSLGDSVKIDTDLAKSKLSGAVLLTWDGLVMPMANGIIHADGTLSVFGPKLHVTDGQVRFNDVEVINPVLDIRAERDVFGNTQIHSAGVAISGLARHPVIEAYTHPVTTNDRAWALLITGSDVDYGQGVGAFEVGTYIAPKLYLGYGISLFDDDNVVSARYDLKKGFGVKASSGQRESGIDMSYTIEH